jgi:hypothetical protein
MSVEYLIKFEDVVNSLLNMYLCGVCSFILTKADTNQM